ncbi:flagellar basal body P-ring formation chaperone FlgA [Undibacterium flavidum]|uniref:Flagella basal body P-ring formation protein FlgA n=1 Tax=Undibacterium flavidum TaxID=2762297 RepID=A0ABR6YER7_9BURK|nr:flagellar basal body P-ring formation chaperone FlgA [Undibacterium flavidum]MBC3874997.1 flagellar basal body P-ring formation protein FlgA [Undibacterium flavidum]
MNIKFLQHLFCFALGIQAFPSAIAQVLAPTPPLIELGQLPGEVEKFLKSQSSNLGAETEINVKPVDPRLKLQACAQLNAFLPPGSKAWGKVTVGLRCTDPKPWTIYVAAHVRVFGDYYVARNAISAGQVLNEQDIVKMHGELSNQASGIIIKSENAIGKTMLTAVPAGTGIRQDMFKLIPIIQQGQSIKIVSQGNGFRVSNDAVALNNASEGQLTRAKTNSGRLVSGIARVGGIIEVQ